MTASGLQVYGKSTSDLRPDRNASTASGLRLSEAADTGVAEMRINRNADGAMTSATVILRTLGISWNGNSERPPIIERFDPTAGRTEFGADGALTSRALPPLTDTAFWNRTDQANYANNRYFPRTAPRICPTGWPDCPSVETLGLTEGSPGTDWRTGGVIPDNVRAGRLHSDGDIDAPNVPYPGSKGYRTIELWGYQYVNLGAWQTQDTTRMIEWGAPSGDEYNTNRRGLVSFGRVTPAADLPVAGTTTYTGGFVYGWYAPNGIDEPVTFRGRVTANVDFAGNLARFEITDLREERSGTQLPLATIIEVPLTPTAANGRSVVTSPLTIGTLTGGIGARFYGPSATSSNGAGPAEIGGTFRLAGPGGAAAVAGFVAPKRAP